MKKQILAIMLMLPLLVAFVAMGFTKLVSIAIPQLPEDIMIEYSADEAFEFDDFLGSMELKGHVIPESSGQTLIWSSSDENIAKIDGNTLTFREEGKVTITATVKNTDLSKSFTAMLMLSGDFPKYVKANFEFPSEKGENTVGLFDFADSLVGEETRPHTEVIDCAVLPAKAPQNISVEVEPQCEFRTEGTRVYLTPSKAGKYTVRIRSAENADVETEIEFEAADCVNIYSYEDLIRATNKSEEGKKMALRVNLESEANLGRFNSRHFGFRSGESYDFSEFDSTYDTLFLQRSKKSISLKAAVVIKADVFGNGHTLNLHDFAYPTEVDSKTGIAIPSSKDVFAANPLEFVTAAGLTVFGQGNVGFLVRGDDITVDNIVLKNCNNVSDLSNLDYVGTVLEIMGDGISIKNSTVQNGRTVVRSFSNKDLLIENCILAYAREFIYKQGSNKFVYPDGDKEWEEVQGELFEYENLPEEAKSPDSTATIRDTDFYRSGIFSIGIDAHFAGKYLYKWIGSNQSVSGLAATSYKSVLNLEGDIRFFDWKKLKELDSSTLVGGSFSGMDFQFNINDLLKKYDNAYGNGAIIKTVKGNEYVHGGIAFFGGGYNISEIYYNGTRVKSSEDDNYDGLNDDTYISFRASLTDSKVFDATEGIFSLAVGEGYFSFCIYRNDYDEIGIDDSPFGKL